MQKQDEPQRGQNNIKYSLRNLKKHEDLARLVQPFAINYLAL